MPLTATHSHLDLQNRENNAMPAPIALTGRFVRINEAFLREKANRSSDPRYIFLVMAPDNIVQDAWTSADVMLTLTISDRMCVDG